MSVNSAQERYEQLKAEEERLSFEHFSREDAWEFAMLLYKNGRKYCRTMGFEITLNGLCVFRYLPEETTRDHAMWLERKRRTVEFREMSPLRFQAWLEMDGSDFKNWKVDTDQYVLGGGAFPITIRGTGVVGSICTTNMPGNAEQEVITETISEYLGR